MFEFSDAFMSDDYYNLIPSNCKYCNQPIVMNYEQTIMFCSNRYCPEHMAHRADVMFKELNFKGIGANTAYDIIKKNNLKCHMDILGIGINDFPPKHSMEVRNKILLTLKQNRRQPLGKILRMYQIDDIADRKADKIVDGFSSFTEFFEKNPDGASIVQHLRKALGQQKMTEHLGKMAYHLIQEKDELIRIEKYFDIVTLSDKKIKVCLTGEISSVYITGEKLSPREKFVHIMNDKYEGIISLVNTGRSVSEADILITDSTKKTGKYKDAINLKRPIMKFADFVGYMETQYGEGKPEIVFNRRN